jgi:3-keto-disaccharide hydrolase
VALSPAAGGPAREFRFTRDSLGKLPAGWKAERTGKGKGSVWKVVADVTAPGKTGFALAQTVAGPSSLFNLCVVEGTRFQNGEVSVAFKAVAGKLDQGGGIVWRLQDANNYYVARMNPLEDNLRLYKVVAGKRTQLATREGLKVAAGEWHTLKIRQVGERIECYLDGKKLLEATDRTFPNAGRVGLWTKADAQTHFDSFVVIQAKE